MTYLSDMTKNSILCWSLLLGLIAISCAVEPELRIVSTAVTINPGDTDLHVLKMGQGPAIIFVHGGPGLSHHYFRPTMDYLAREYELIYYDQRLSGLSAAECDSSKVTLAQWVEDLESVRKGIGRDSVILISHSWGARIAIRYAEKYPEHLSGMVFMNPISLNPDYAQAALATLQGRITLEDQHKQESLMNSEAFKNGEPSAIKKLYTNSFAQNIFDKTILDSLNLYIPDRATARQQLMGLLYRDPQVTVYNDYNLLGEIATPSLIIHGSYDASPIAAIELMDEKLPHSQLEIIQESGHFSFIEQQKNVKKELIQFLNNLEREEK